MWDLETSYACRVAAHLALRISRPALHAPGDVCMGLPFSFRPCPEGATPEGSVPHPVVVGVDPVEHSLLPRDLLPPAAVVTLVLFLGLLEILLEPFPGVAGVELPTVEVVVGGPVVVDLPLTPNARAVDLAPIAVDPGDELLGGGEPSVTLLLTLGAVDPHHPAGRRKWQIGGDESDVSEGHGGSEDSTLPGQGPGGL